MRNMVELNRELLLEELSNFEKKKCATDIPDILNRYLERVAQNGDTIFTWTKLQPLLRRKLDLVMDEFNEKCPTDDLAPLPNVKPFDFDELKSQILESIDSFVSTPFTIQRLCELITDPTKHYKRTDKFMRGIEKNILVVSTVEPKSLICDELQYTSSFKGLFSSHHSTAILTQSLLSPVSSSSSSASLLLVNGVADGNCENQVVSKPTEDNISDTNEQQKCHLNSSPVSPTSMPLSPTTNSPPNMHLAPLQQLDSFTTVFASTPSTTPLSVVSDLHSYDKPLTLSLITSTHSSSLTNEKSSLTTTTNTELDKSQIDSSLETVDPQTDPKDNIISLNVASNTDEINDSKDSTADSIKNEELHNNNVVTNADNDNSEKLINVKEKDDEVVNEEVVKDTAENELTTETKTKNLLDDSETASKKQKVISSEISLESNVENESSPSNVCESQVKQEENVSTHSKEADTDENSNDTEMSTPMDYCGSCYTNNSDLISSSTTQLTSECNSMDAEIDQIEPMDQD